VKHFELSRFAGIADIQWIEKHTSSDWISKVFLNAQIRKRNGVDRQNRNGQ
jgi:hypothetical protein